MNKILMLKKLNSHKIIQGIKKNTFRPQSLLKLTITKIILINESLKFQVPN